tara:strand:- start:189 stop:773 length:585 start_codon:yes stop_codon:yes gene_type:complete
MADGNDSKSLDSEYLAALRDTDLYKQMFQMGYQDPKEAIERVGHYHGIVGRYGTAFETERSEESPYDTNYSEAAQQLRQFIVRDGPEENNPRDFKKNANFGYGSRLKDKQAVAQLALTEALEAHEQQGKRFVDTYGGSKVRTGFPKSTRSMGKTVEPLRGPTGPDGSEAVPFDKYNQNSKKTADQTLMENMRKK